MEQLHNYTEVMVTVPRPVPPHFPTQDSYQENHRITDSSSSQAEKKVELHPNRFEVLGLSTHFLSRQLIGEIIMKMIWKCWECLTSLVRDFGRSGKSMHPPQHPMALLGANRALQSGACSFFPSPHHSLPYVPRVHAVQSSWGDEYIIPQACQQPQTGQLVWGLCPWCKQPRSLSSACSLC